MSEARTYQLLIEVTRPLTVVVGSLGPCRFPAGRYIYTGSAKRNLQARIARHLRQDKKLHWHIDYLLTQPGVRVAGVRRYADAECDLNRRTPGIPLLPGFGASDCKAGCGSHLKFIDADATRTA
ncbi:GIY-YIG nuclease family protein [Denitratisoma sp. agr-D3]